MLTDSLALSLTQFSLQTLFTKSTCSIILYRHGAILANVKAVDGLIGSVRSKNGFALAQPLDLAC